MPVETILEFANVSLKYDQAWALHDISLKLHPGETRIIFGQAGSGKTTLLKAVIGLIPVDRGQIYLFGYEVTGLNETRLFGLRGRTGFLFQEGGLFDSLTVGENVEYPILNQQAAFQQADEDKTAGTPEQRVREALRFVELEHTFDNFPSSISGGMRRRVGIARAIVTAPPLLLYDSPTAGLDPITANTIMSLVAKERDVRNSASLIVTNRYQDGEIMAGYRWDDAQQELVPVTSEDPKCNRTRFIVMKDGAIAFEGTRQQMEASSDDYVQKFIRHEG
ncbi:MAG TPA: ATP-binding cassette domain-containing protein [Bryobacteraceae bacterium]|jgi:phospholipid/cholesterol/gamma-HCH transport system ATP-binding protein|nr:ATP-binding cassette domain-containing protein [Bryobacteraceae bacterium]